MRRLRFLLCVLSLLCAVSVGAASSASAASSVSACFTYQGAGVQGLTTNLEYLWTNGTWRYLGAEAVTHSDGCISYSIRGTWRQYTVRVRATAGVPSRNAIASAVSPYYAPGGTSSYKLGTGAIQLFAVPAVSEWDVTGTWLEEMDHPKCTNSAAMLVACYMQQNGMTPSTVYFPDWDRDGWWDLADRYWRNPGYH